MWVWDEKARRYRDTDTGRFLPRQDVLGYVQASLDASGIASDVLASFAANGNLSPQDFISLFREEIKREYIRQYLLGYGGREQMTFSDWGSIGAMLRGQYGYLPGFLDALLRGELSEAQVMARARMYINGARQAFEAGRGKNAKALAMGEELWVLGTVRTEHCRDCINFAGMGWQPMGTFPRPGDGSTVCLSNCACSKLYRDPESGAQY